MLLWFCLILISGCGDDDYSTQEQRLVDFVADNPVGHDDYWLVKANAYGGPVKVALVFGWNSDADECQELAKFYSRRFAPDRYDCFPRK